jgi:cytochrome c-type biogenesis protein CcmH
MMTIIAVIAAGWALLLALMIVGRAPRSSWVPYAATVMLGVAAWAVTGRPGVPGSPAVQPENEQFGRELEDPRGGMSDRFGPAAQWLGLADGLMRGGRTESAAKALEQGLRRYPRNIDLWVGYGNALVAHSGGVMTPAAAMAFDRAAAIDPRHPAPAFFAGLALAQGGDIAGARVVWQELLERSPADAPYRADLEARLAALPGVEIAPEPSAPATPSP